MNYDIENIVMKDAHIIFRNFKGEETKFNRAGNRNFCVVIDDADYAQQLREIGWNVRSFDTTDKNDDPVTVYYIPVAVSYKIKPPKVVICTRKNRIELDEDSIEALDYADIISCKVAIRPYSWEVNGKSGIKAYLKTMHVTLEEDEFEDDDDSDPIF